MRPLQHRNTLRVRIAEKAMLLDNVCVVHRASSRTQYVFRRLLVYGDTLSTRAGFSGPDPCIRLVVKRETEAEGTA